MVVVVVVVVVIIQAAIEQKLLANDEQNNQHKTKCATNLIAVSKQTNKFPRKLQSVCLVCGRATIDSAIHSCQQLQFVAAAAATATD